jgi:ribosomal protein L37AE/L43A
LLIDYQCPQCGAPAVLEETDRLFTCTYCRVKSCLIPKGVFRYTLSHAVDTGRQIVFFPYWRYRGARFSCMDTEIRHQFVDITHQAVESVYFPATMGLRAQAMRLSFVSSQSPPGRFLAPALPLKDVLLRQEARFKTAMAKHQLYHLSHVGEVLSLIYAPFYVGAKVIDAVLNRPVSGPLPESLVESLPTSDPSGWQMQLLSAICPSCGWNLSGERNAVVLTCTNCNSAWQPSGGSLKPVPIAFMPDETADMYLPFWRIKADVSGMPLSCYADLARLANLPRVVQKGWNDIPFYFWSLAFRLSPKFFLSLSVRMNLIQPRDEVKEGNPPGKCYPATLSSVEAADTLKTSLAGMMKPVETGYPKLPDIQIQASEFSLVYLPFQSGHHEWLQPRYCLAINKNMLFLTDH